MEDILRHIILPMRKEMIIYELTEKKKYLENDICYNFKNLGYYTNDIASIDCLGENKCLNCIKKKKKNLLLMKRGDKNRTSLTF